MLFHTQNPLQFAFSQAYGEYDFKSIKLNDKTNFGLIGIPFDGTSTYKIGSRYGPKAVREASYNLERYNLVLDKNLDVSLFDFGDIEIIQGNFKKTCNTIYEAISELKSNNILPLSLGGEHLISYGILKALDIENTTIIHFDAHMDLRNEYMGEKYSHATVMHRIFDLNPKEIIQIGIRSCSEYEMLFANENQISYFTSYDVDQDINMVMECIKNVKGPLYISLDVDVLDPAYAPNVSTPSPCGITPFQLESLIHCLKGKEVIGFDLVEVASAKIGDITSINGAKAIYDFLCTR